MNKKELRKELELTLAKAIGEVLNKKNAAIAKEISKSTGSASKSIAKKFYKALKSKTKAVTPIVKLAAKTTTVAKTKPTSKKPKIAIKPARPAGKKVITKRKK